MLFYEPKNVKRETKHKNATSPPHPQEYVKFTVTSFNTAFWYGEIRKFCDRKLPPDRSCFFLHGFNCIQARLHF